LLFFLSFPQGNLLLESIAKAREDLRTAQVSAKGASPSQPRAKPWGSTSTTSKGWKPDPSTLPQTEHRSSGESASPRIRSSWASAASRRTCFCLCCCFSVCHPSRSGGSAFSFKFVILSAAKDPGIYPCFSFCHSPQGICFSNRSPKLAKIFEPPKSAPKARRHPSPGRSPGDSTHPPARA